MDNGSERAISPVSAAPTDSGGGISLDLAQPHGDFGEAAEGRESDDIEVQSDELKQDEGRVSGLRSWIKDSISLVVASGLLVAIAVILARYDGDIVPEWRYSISLNTIVAVLSTIIRVLLLSAVEAAISQLKWAWYQKPRPAREMVYFDQASRGAWGSMVFIFRARRLLSIAILGCLLTILSSAIAPFSQQAIQQVACNKPLLTGKPTLPIAESISSSLYYEAFITNYGPSHQWTLDQASKGKIIDIIANPTQNQSSLVSGCTSGDCTFPSENGITHSSIGICTKCIDASSLIQSGWVNGSGSLGGNIIGIPGGPYVSDTGMGAMNSSAQIPGTSLEFITPVVDEEFEQLSNFAILAQTTVTSTYVGCTEGAANPWTYPSGSPWHCNHNGMNVSVFWNGTNWVGTTCLIYPCTRFYHAEVVGSVLNETLVSTVPAPALVYSNETFRAHVGVNRTCTINGSQRDMSQATDVQNQNGSLVLSVDGQTFAVPDDCTLPFDEKWLYAVQDFLRTNLQGHCYYSFGFSASDPSTAVDLECYPPGVAFTNYDWWWLSGMLNQGNATFESLSNVMSAVAETITNRVRVTGVEPDSNNSTVVYGTMTQSTVCVRFNSRWLAMPAVLLALSIIFLAIVVWYSATTIHDQPIWKSSILPLLYAAPEEHLGSVAGTNKKLEAKSTTDTLQLERKVGGWIFVSVPPKPVIEHD